MPRSFSDDEWELMDLPRQLAYEQSRFGILNPVVVGAGPDCLTIDQAARTRHAALLARQTELKYRIRRRAVLDRWVMRRYRCWRSVLIRPPVEPFTAMGMDEVIQDGKIVDAGF